MKITLTITDCDLRLVLRGLLEMENEIRNEWRKRTDSGACYKSEIARANRIRGLRTALKEQRKSQFPARLVERIKKADGKQPMFPLTAERTAEPLVSGLLPLLSCQMCGASTPLGLPLLHHSSCPSRHMTAPPSYVQAGG